MSSPNNVRAIASLSSVYLVRMLGLFMVLPVLSLAMSDMPGATPSLIGLAIGIYGFSQGLLQLPLAAWSDRIGRKPVIFLGLCVFIIGSLVAAASDSVYGIILGRFLQGAGAIASTTMALLADLLPEDQRAKAMATIGASIGVAFGVAMVVGPWLQHSFGLSGLFYTTAILSVLALLIVKFVVPNPDHVALSNDVRAVGLRDVVTQPELVRLNVGVFALHGSLMALFVALPELLKHKAGIGADQLPHFYLVVLGASFILMLPFVGLAEGKRRMRGTLWLAIISLVAGAALLLELDTLVGIGVAVFIYFFGFTLCEALMPSLVSKLAPAGRRGAAMGSYSTSQFVGTFIGGSIGGLAAQYGGELGALSAALLLLVIWLVVALSMKQVSYLTNDSVPIDSADGGSALTAFKGLDGVEHAVFDQDTQRIYIKYDKKVTDTKALALLHQQYTVV